MARITRKGQKRNKLTRDQAIAVRDAEGLQADIAIRFGISQAMVSAIKGGKRRVK